MTTNAYSRMEAKSKEIAELRELIRNSIPFVELQDSDIVRANILHGTIKLSTLSALHIAGVTNIEGWRELFGWCDEEQCFKAELRNSIPKPTVEIRTHKGYPAVFLNDILIGSACSDRGADPDSANMLKCESMARAVRAALGLEAKP